MSNHSQVRPDRATHKRIQRRRPCAQGADEHSTGFCRQPFLRNRSLCELEQIFIQCQTQLMTTLPLTEAKAKLNELVEEAVRTHERVTITRHGRPAVVLISVDDLEAIEETMFWQAEPDMLADVAAGRAEDDAGDLFNERVIRRRYGVGSAR